MSSRTYKITQPDNSGTERTVLEISIEQPEGKFYKDILWDSKTGLVTAEVYIGGISQGRQAIPYKGKGMGKLNPAPLTAHGISDMEYSYWYN